MAYSFRDDDMHYLLSTINYRQLEKHTYQYKGDEIYCEELEKLSTNYEGIKEICIHITGVLNEINNLPITTLFQDRCEFVNYWIFDKLFKTYPTHNIYEIILRLLNIRQKKDPNDICIIRQDLNVKNDFYKMKLLYDYALDNNTIQHNNEKRDFTCSKTYSDYVTNYHKNYHDVKGECDNGDTKLYCELFRKINQIVNKNNLLLLKPCLLKISTMSDSEEVGSIKTRETLDTAKFGDEDHGEKAVVNSLQSSSTDLSVDTTSSTSMAIVFPLIGISLIIFILHKFTPLGFWIQSRWVKKKTIGLYNDEEEIDKCLGNTYESSNKNTDNNEHNVSYHAFRNSSY
ncbi:PIR protein [Plasmodium ovale]|uniref:PIR protein n=1 Tax=Plasmodium ovale TaxID=36330 RepID=A0A1D3JBQ5_PLAOA|nr:PIR protein [Plasmodium ovale]